MLLHYTILHYMALYYRREGCLDLREDPNKDLRDDLI